MQLDIFSFLSVLIYCTLLEMQGKYLFIIKLFELYLKLNFLSFDINILFLA